VCVSIKIEQRRDRDARLTLYPVRDDAKSVKMIDCPSSRAIPHRHSFLLSTNVPVLLSAANQIDPKVSLSSLSITPYLSVVAMKKTTRLSRTMLQSSVP